MQYTIDVTDDLRETKAHGIPSFPLETHNCAFRLSSNGIINWHWHPEIELSRISRGKVYCSAGSETCLLEEGQYSFINSNVLLCMGSKEHFSNALFRNLISNDKLYPAKIVSCINILRSWQHISKGIPFLSISYVIPVSLLTTSGTWMSF